MEDDVKRLKMELKQTMDMYNAACKEALAAKQKVPSALNFRLPRVIAPVVFKLVPTTLIL